ncbi:hypothetical protein JCM19239_6050 [Vibrio variabilis]|uniref:Uncharacterized protein n=1 Tax=Vibrio variabilis TaxID=990271 RepID=A0ABQ0JLR9_9VIBR|nr:hypothetical protein JCM19239_6050 [Vibrio variabilis]
MNYDTLHRELKTGDIVLFSGKAGSLVDTSKPIAIGAAARSS